MLGARLKLDMLQGFQLIEKCELYDILTIENNSFDVKITERLLSSKLVNDRVNVSIISDPF